MTVADTGSVGGDTAMTGGSLDNSGTLADVSVGDAATFNNLAGGEAAALETSGTSTNADGGTLASATVTDGTLDNSGDITGTLDITGGAVTVADTGSVGGDTAMTGGTLDNDGTIAGASVGGGTLTNNNSLNGDVAVSGTGLLTNNADLLGNANVSGTGILTNNATLDGDVTVQAAGTFNNLAGGTANALVNAGTATNLGTIAGNLSNSGTLSSSGTINGDLNNSGTGTVSGAVNGILQNEGAGSLTIDNNLTGLTGITQQSSSAIVIGNNATVALEPGANVGSTGQFVLNAGAALNGQAGSQFTNAAGGMLEVLDGGSLAMALENAINATADILGVVDGNVSNLGDISLTGTVQGNVNNLRSGGGVGTFTAAGTGARVTGLLNNTGNISFATAGPTTLTLGALQQGANGVLDMQNNRSGDRLIIAGDADLQGRVRFDVDVSATGTTFDSINIDNRLTMNNVVLSFNNVGDNAGLTGPYPVVTFGEAGPLSFTTEGLSGSSAVVYQVVNTGNALELQSGANPALAGLASGIGLTQSLIGSVVNRPSSAFVTGLAAQSDAVCGRDGTGVRSDGTWVRAISGFADATGSASTSLGKFDNDFRVDYNGLQAGLDLGCARGAAGGFDLNYGILAGINYATTEQPVFDFNSVTGQVDRSRLLSTNITDLTQNYVGVYMTAARERLFGDLQLRLDRSSLDLRNVVAPGGLALGVDDQTYESTGTTVSGSVGYAFTLDAERGISLIPTAGFAYSDSSVDQVTFSDGRVLDVDTVRSRVNFASLTLARAQFLEDTSSALSYFATGTIYSDAGSATSSRFVNPSDPDFVPVLSEVGNLDTYGEVSVGVNLTRLLERGDGRPQQQMDTSLRVDGRIGDRIESVGVTAQLRVQF